MGVSAKFRIYCPEAEIATKEQVEKFVTEAAKINIVPTSKDSIKVPGSINFSFNKRISDKLNAALKDIELHFGNSLILSFKNWREPQEEEDYFLHTTGYTYIGIGIDGGREVLSLLDNDKVLKNIRNILKEEFIPIFNIAFNVDGKVGIRVYQ